MWAWSAAGPSELRLERARLPAVTAPDQVLLRVEAAALNPLDVAMTAGYGAALLGPVREPGPLVLGRDVVGRVVAAGRNVRGPAAREGERLWGALPPHEAGSLRQYVVTRACWLGPAPARVDAVRAAALPYAGLTAASALRAGDTGAGAAGSWLVVGLGAVGGAALQLLAARGARVTVCCTARREERAHELGAAGVVVAGRSDTARLLAELGPHDAVLDCAGLGGERAAEPEWRARRYVTLTSPLLRHTDRRGLCVGLASSGAAWAEQSWRAARAGGGAVRWAYFRPSPDTMDLLRRLVDAGQVSDDIRMSE